MAKKPQGPIRILIADDHTIVREGLRTMLAPKVDFKLVGEAADGIEALSQCQALQPDVILLDLIMPRKSGLEVIDDIQKSCPAAKILILTSFSEENKVVAAIRAGARGYILKDSSPQELVQAIRSVHSGDFWLFPGVAPKVVEKLLSPHSSKPAEVNLTEREIAVLKLIAEGFTNKEIANALGVVEGTIRFHINNILGKLHLTNRTQAALYAIREGIVSLYG